MLIQNYRKNTKKNQIFHGLFLLHNSRKKEVIFLKFFDHLKNVLSSVAHKDDFNVWKTNLFFVSDQENAIKSAIDAVFLNCQRILCSMHINENIKFY